MKVVRQRMERVVVKGLSVSGDIVGYGVVGQSAGGR